MTHRRDITTLMVVGLAFGICSFDVESASNAMFPADQPLVYTVRHKDGNAIYRSLADGSQKHRLSAQGESANWPVPSPDGQRVLYQHWENKKIDIWSVDVNGRNARALTTHEDHDYLPAWYGDSRSFVYLGWRTLGNQRKPQLFASSASKPQEVTFGDWSTDGSNSPYVIAGTQAVLLYRNLEEKTELWQWHPKRSAPELWISVDGYGSGFEYSERRKKLYFSLDSAKGNTSIAEFDPATQQLRELYILSPAWYPHLCANDEWLVITEKHPRVNEHYRLLLLHIDTGQTQPLNLSDEPVVEGRCLPTPLISGDVKSSL